MLFEENAPTPAIERAAEEDLAQKRAAEEDLARKRAEEELAQKRAAEVELARRRAEEESAQKRAAEVELARRRAEEELAQSRLEEELARRNPEPFEEAVARPTEQKSTGGQMEPVQAEPLMSGGVAPRSALEARGPGGSGGQSELESDVGSVRRSAHAVRPLRRAQSSEISLPLRRESTGHPSTRSLHAQPPARRPEFRQRSAFSAADDPRPLDIGRDAFRGMDSRIVLHFKGAWQRADNAGIIMNPQEGMQATRLYFAEGFEAMSERYPEWAPFMIEPSSSRLSIQSHHYGSAMRLRT